ncbi:MAG: TonB-dependent receptor [Acidobacteriaceae bacterium]|nr:TonB-dependent receptor [Acidobacteriaceae bacterium]
MRHTCAVHPIRLSQLICLALSLSAVPWLAVAQNTNSGEIRGTVTDPTGAVVPGVEVTVLNTDTGVTKALTTNDAGIYDAVSVLPGRYELTFSKTGFEKLVRQGIDLPVGLTTVDAQLTVGTTQQQVSVTGEAPLLQTENGEQSTTLDAQTMQTLPNVDQSWSNFTKLLPGAAGSGTGVAVNGNLPYYNNFLADGANVMLPHSANFDQMVFEDVAEVQMNTSTFSAEYGVGGAVFNQISKGGTNQWHGSAYEYFQNDALNARNFFSATVPFERFDNFGGAVGGPILKNKFFFFFNVDKTINNSSGVYTNTFPTADMRVGNFSNLAEFPIIYEPNTLGLGPHGGRIPFPNNTIPTSMLDPLALKFQSLFPAPNQSGYSNNWVGTLESPDPFLKWFGRLDYNLSDKNRITFSITQSDNPAFYPQAYPIGNQSGDVDRYNAQISDVHTISPNTVNEFRYGFTRQGNWFEPLSLNKNYPQNLGWTYPVANLPPSLQFDGTPGTTWIGPSTNAIYVENGFDTSDVVTLIRGRHILKFGGEILAYQDNSTPWGNINAGTFLFSGAFTQAAPNGSGGLGYADFLLGQVASWSASNTPIVGFREKIPQFFIQDDFKVTPTLTVNLGLRYQIQQGWHEIDNRIGDFDPTLINPVTNTPGAMWFGGQDNRTNLENTIYDIFLPRVGFAWSMHPNWVVRGGFGIYDGPWSLDTYSGGSEGLGTNSHGSLTSTDQIHPVFTLSQATYGDLNYTGPNTNPASFNGQGPPYYPRNTPMLRTYQWSFSIEHQFGGGMMAQAAYVGNHGTNLSFPNDPNQVPANLLMQSVANPGNAQNLRPFPQFTTIGGNAYDGISNYDSLQLTFKKSFTHGLQFDVNYTWSKMLDDQDSSGWGSRDGGQLWQDAYNPALNYSLSNFDIPQMFKGDLVYDLPFGKGRQWMNSNYFLDAVFGGWQIATTFVFESGSPFTPLVGTNDNSGALSGSWYPNLIGNPHIANPSVGNWFNTCTVLQDGSTYPTGCTNPAWAVPTPGTFGNAGRNILWGPGIEDVDFSLGKNFHFPLPHETGNLQIRFDALNGLNHPNFSAPGNSLGTSGAGIITSTTGNYNTTNNSFGQRIIQLGARISF